MSEQAGSPEDRFSCVAAVISSITEMYTLLIHLPFHIFSEFQRNL